MACPVPARHGPDAGCNVRHVQERHGQQFMVRVWEERQRRRPETRAPAGCGQQFAACPRRVRGLNHDPGKDRIAPGGVRRPRPSAPHHRERRHPVTGHRLLARRPEHRNRHQVSSGP